MRNPIIQKTAGNVARNEQARNAVFSAAQNPTIQNAVFNTFTQSQQQSKVVQKNTKNEPLYPELKSLDPFKDMPQLPSSNSNQFQQRHEERIMWNKSAAPTTETNKKWGPSLSTTCDDLNSVFSNSKLF